MENNWSQRLHCDRSRPGYQQGVALRMAQTAHVVVAEYNLKTARIPVKAALGTGLPYPIGIFTGGQPTDGGQW
jgi:hypothetical protein